MNLQPAVDFSDLDDLDTAVVVEDSKAPPKSYLAAAANFAENHEPTKWDILKARKSADRPVIDCPKCRGTGKFYSFTGRLVGNCLKCDGSGKTIGLKQDTASVKAREQAAARREAKKAEAEAAKIAWREEHADVLDWISRNDSFDFAVSLGEAIAKWGTLTGNQVAAARRCIEREAARKAERAVQAAQAAPTQGLDLSAVPAGRYAVPGGDTRLKVMIQKPSSGKWGGFVFVRDAAAYGEGNRYGLQAPGQAYRGQIVEQLKAIAADPEAAAVAYGRLTSVCSRCGRPLEDEASVARGIGPVCAKLNGW
jgi:hypothetical protein